MSSVSYFFSGFLTEGTDLKEIEASFIDVIPGDVTKDVLRIEGESAFLINYGMNKTIPDLVDHEKGGSWLAVLGTPLVHFAVDEGISKLMERYLENPQRCLSSDIDGSFAVLSYDARGNKFSVATDVNNTTAVFYAVSSKGVFFSSHELPLARYLQSEIDPLGFSLTIQLKYPWGTQARFRGIKKLLPCQHLEFRGNADPRSEIYWRPSSERLWEDNFDGVVDRWAGSLKASVQSFHQCSSNKRVICTLTAGEDARLLLAQCHALRIPFSAMVDGLEDDIDVQVSKVAARRAGFDLAIRPSVLINEEQLIEKGTYISIMNDAYEDYFRSCSAFAIDAVTDPQNREYVKYCGVPGGEAYRGAYYLRGKVLSPSRMGNFDHRFFTRMKFLLDFHPRLLRLADEEMLNTIFSMIEEALREVRDFPIGIKIDHLIRSFQTCNNTGLIWKNPLYLPLATREMTRTVYNVPPRYKRAGRMTKACTEMLWPELALVRTQKGVPTIRRTPLRAPLFWPEYLANLRSVARGTVSRLLKWSDSNKPSYKWSDNAPAIRTLLTKSPYAGWFSSPDALITGYLYDHDRLGSLLADARQGSSRYVPILGRIINQELACRWVYREQ